MTKDSFTGFGKIRNSQLLNIIDIDDQESWPPEVRSAVQEKAEILRGTTGFFGDLDAPVDEEDPFRELTHGFLIRAYHATRLLEHEVGDIRRQGLRPLTQSLIERRIRKAVERNHLHQQAGDALLAGNALMSRAADTRSDKVCLFLSHIGLSDDVADIWPLLTVWGGEGINFTRAGADHRERLSIGTPAIVVALLDLSSGGRRTHHVFPGLKHLFVGKYLGFDGSEQRFGSSVHYYASIPPECIEDIRQPGNPDYDRYPDLPRE